MFWQMRQGNAGTAWAKCSIDKLRFTYCYKGWCDRCQEIELEDKFENMGAQMVKEVFQDF